MTITFVYPFDLAQTPINVDSEKDFVRIAVNSSGYVESNKFLISLWNQVNTCICPDHCVDRAPWAYFPGKFVGKTSAISVLGFCNTSIGDLYFALEYRKKGDIDTLLVMRTTSKLKHEEIKRLKLLVENAKANMNNTNCYLCKAIIYAEMKNIYFTEYTANNFGISQSDGGFMFRFYVNAIDKFEAEQQALERLYEICAFLTVETNIHMSFDEFTVRENEHLPKVKSSYPFIEDYLDGFPTNENWQICISSYAYRFISEKILSIGRFEKRNEVENFFISACKHLQIGLENELKIGEIGVANFPYSTFSIGKTNQINKIENITTAMMSYLSAIECVTVTEADHKTCKECGQIIYKIADRVRNLSAEFLGPYLGNVFHKLYAYRSKFLHTGRMASDTNKIRTIPLLSESSETGVKEYGNVAVKVDGKILSLGITNIREWTTYILRCFYQKRILGRMSFENVFIEKRELTIDDLPITISAVSPEGGELMKKYIIKTDSVKYKIHSFFTLVLVRLKRIFNKLNDR